MLSAAAPGRHHERRCSGMHLFTVEVPEAKLPKLLSKVSADTAVSCSPAKTRLAHRRQHRQAAGAVDFGRVPFFSPDQRPSGRGFFCP